MENRQSHVLVGAVTLLLLLALAGFIMWLSNYSGEKRKEYDIFFQQSVAGLAVGSGVNFSGVPVGQVKTIALMPQSPEFVRVRIEVQPEVPVLSGTTAALSGVGFTGVTVIQLAGATRGQQPITEPGPYGVPVIPAVSSGFGQLLETAPQVLERASTLLARLNEVFDDENRAALASTLRNIDKATTVIANEGPAIQRAMREAETSLKALQAAADEFGAASKSANSLLSEEGRPLLADLRNSTRQLDVALAKVGALAATAQPGVQSLSTETIPELNRLIVDLRDMSGQLGDIAAKIDSGPLGALTGSKNLPDYKPEKRK